MKDGTLLRGLAFDLGSTLLIVALVSLLDFLTGVQLSFSLFYLLPVFLISWRRGLYYGLAFSILCVLLRLLADKLGGKEYAHPYIAYWNTGVRAGVLAVTAVLVANLREAIRRAGEARDAALSASRAKSEFLSSMSHEIRTPLGAMLAMADELAETRLDATQAEYLRLFRQEGPRLLSLVNDLLDSAKIEAGSFKADRIAFSLPSLLAELGSIVGSQARAKGLDFSLESSPVLPDTILGDPVLLRRTLLNLTSNAVKFTSGGRIGVAAGPDPEAPGRLLFSVSDTGMGIPKESLDRLFVPFAQADASIWRRFGGTGLGLSLCKRFVEAMGGTIEATSLAGEGSVFSFRIPLEIPASGDGAERREEEGPPRVVHRPLDILLVEDYEPNRAIVRAFLKASPYRVDEAPDGRIGLEKYERRRYDLVLMDVQMPEMDGYQAARAIRALEAEGGRGRVPIIALTARAFDEDAREARAAGFDARLVKPYTKRQLLAAIADAVGEGPAVGAFDPDIAELVPAFLRDLGALVLQAREALRGDGFDRLRGIGHKLKGSGGSFGFDRVSELGAELESAAARGDSAAAERILGELDGFRPKEEGS